MEKFGFIYIWYDRKHKRYYLGSHWGFEEDGYICSSDNMRKNYKNRPQDFKRRILKRVYTNQTDLFNEEQYWLDMIKPNEIGFQYYNLNKVARGFGMWANEEVTKLIKEKISKKLKGNINGATIWSEEQKEKNKSSYQYQRTEAQLEACKEKVKKMHKASPASKPGWIPKHRIGTKHTEETKKQMALKRKEFYASAENAKKIGEAISKGKKAANRGFRAQFFLDYLKDKEWMTSQQISKDTKLGWDTVYRYLRDLSKENKVQKQLKGRDAYWRLSPRRLIYK